MLNSIHFESYFLNDSMVDCKRIVFLKKLVERRGIVIMNLTSGSWSLFILLFSVRLWNIQTKAKYANREEKIGFVTVLSLSLVIYFEIRSKACNLSLAVLQSLKPCSLKVSLLSMKIPNNFLELPFISVPWILIEAVSFEVIKSWDFSGLAFR